MHMIHHKAEINKNEKDLARLESAWSTKHRRVDSFQRARNGYRLLVPYECNLCTFQKLKRCYPNVGHPQDEILDSLLSQASGTVSANTSHVNAMLCLSGSVGLMD
mmetsp:Transcript_8220/g.11746  ORF Transcript_8220/g.11746 Transcript_8220/m.11746 type:complete len:105 (+) Transcript_8220:259-573(+)